MSAEKVENYVLVKSTSWGGPQFVLPMEEASVLMNTLRNALCVEECYEEGKHRLYPKLEAPAFQFQLISVSEYAEIHLREPKGVEK